MSPASRTGLASPLPGQARQLQARAWPCPEGNRRSDSHPQSRAVERGGRRRGEARTEGLWTGARREALRWRNRAPAPHSSALHPRRHKAAQSSSVYWQLFRHTQAPGPAVHRRFLFINNLGEAGTTGGQAPGGAFPRSPRHRVRAVDISRHIGPPTRSAAPGSASDLVHSDTPRPCGAQPCRLWSFS